MNFEISLQTFSTACFALAQFWQIIWDIFNSLKKVINNNEEKFIIVNINEWDFSN